MLASLFEEPMDMDADRSTSIVSADLDSDGDLDFVSANHWADDISVWLGNGHGRFDEHKRYATGGAPFFVTTADLNGDQTLDLIVTNSDDDRTMQATGSVSVLIGIGDGTFVAEQRHLTGGSSSAGIVAGDFDGDGDIDVAVGNQYSHNISVLLGSGDGRFAAPVLYPSGGQGTTGITSGDFDRDGDLDLAVANYFFKTEDRTIGVLLGNGDGSFVPAVFYHSGRESWDLKNADVNADGNIDLAVTTVAGPSILLGNGDGTFDPGNLRFTWPPGAKWNRPDPQNPILIPYGHDLGDLDGDGIVDWILANESGIDPATRNSFGLLSVMLGNGDGSFADPIAFESGTWPRSVIAADVDGDGDLDVITTDMISDKLTLRLNTTISAVTAGDANRDSVFNQLDIVQVLQAGKYLTGEPATWSEGDWNGDGVFDHLDLVEVLANRSYLMI